MRWVALAAVALVGVLGTASGALPATIRDPLSLRTGQRLVFHPGELAIGSRLGCTSHGIHVVARVPDRRRSVVKVADGVAGGAATIRLTTRSDGSVVAACS